MTHEGESNCAGLREAAGNSTVGDNPWIDRGARDRYSAWRMRSVRRHLPRVVVSWLFCYAIAFTAVVPRDCCAAHARAAHHSPDAATHDSTHASHAVPSHAHCQMAEHDAAACPMHQPAAPCLMTGACDTPTAILQAVLLGPAVLSAPETFVPLTAPSPWLPSRHAQPVSLAIPPDAPPPKA